MISGENVFFSEPVVDFESVCSWKNNRSKFIFSDVSLPWKRHNFVKDTVCGDTFLKVFFELRNAATVSSFCLVFILSHTTTVSSFFFSSEQLVSNWHFLIDFRARTYFNMDESLKISSSTAEKFYGSWESINLIVQFQNIISAVWQALAHLKPNNGRVREQNALLVYPN